MIKNES